MLGVEADEVTGVRVKNVKNGEKNELKAAAMFVAIGHTPLADLFKGQVELHDNGYIKTTPGTTQTNVTGFFWWLATCRTGFSAKRSPQQARDAWPRSRPNVSSAPRAVTDARGAMSADDPAALRRDLADVARSLRALVEWQDACGAVALPRAAPAPRAEPKPDAAPRGTLTNDERAEASPRVESTRRTEPSTRPAFSMDPPRPEPPRTDAAFAPSEPALTPDERKQRLVVLGDKVKSCTACVLAEKRTQTVFARGNPLAELCFVGEGPGEDEDREGLPFVGKAGQLLDKMIEAMGLGENDVYICNIVKCRPPQNRNPLPLEVAACAPYLTEQLELVRPKVIVTLGNVPLKALFGVEGITKLRGTWRVYKGSVPVMPTYHPAYVLRTPTPQVKGDVWKDLREVLRQLGRTVPQRKT